MIKQTLTILLFNLRSIPSRLTQTLIIVVGIGGVVAVLVSLLSMARGFELTLKATGQDDRALVLRAGSTSEINGSLSIEQYEVIRDLAGVARSNSTKLAAMESFVTVNLPQRDNNADLSVPMRGVSAESFLVRPEIEIVAGRNIEFGKYELIAGASASNQILGIDLNSTVNIRGIDWTIVGVFSASGGALDSEIWVDQKLLAAAWKRGESFSSMLVQLTSQNQFQKFQQLVSSDKRLTAHAIRESVFYAEQSKNTTGLITGIGLLIAAIMSIGAVFAALNSMYAAVSSRAPEIATLRAIGFRPMPIVCSVLIESAFVGAIGALIGGLLVYYTLNGAGVSTAAATSSTFTQIAFKFMVTPTLLGAGVILAIGLGLIGGIFPALHAARRPIIEGLRIRG